MLNQVLVKCRISDIKKYIGKRVKGLVNGKEVVLYFRLLCDEMDVMDGIDLVAKNDNILLLDYIGSDFCPVYMNLTKETVGDVCVIRITDVETELTEKFVGGVVNDTPSGVIPVLRLPEKFKDLELLYKLNQIYPNVRFCGGTLFVVEGCNIGCCKKGVSYDLDAFYRNGVCDCALEVHDFSEVHTIELIGDEKQVDIIEQKKEDTGKQIQFSDLLGGTFL